MSVAARRLFGLALALVVFALDQALKAWLLGPLRIRARVIEMLPVFRFNYSENYGLSLGLAPAASPAGRWVLVALTGAIAVGVLAWIARERRLGEIVGLGLVLGGALGNIADRVARGYVVDYADLHFGEFRPFLIFNLADAAITVGVVVLLVRSIMLEDDGTFGRKARRWFSRKALGHVSGAEEKLIKDRLNG